MRYRLLAPLLLLSLCLGAPAPAQTPPAPTPTPPVRTVLPALPQTAPEPTGWVFLQHFVSPTGDDFYTADGHEQDVVAGTLHYARPGPVGYVYAGPGGAVPLLRYYSPSRSAHYYTGDPSQAPAGGDWRYEGVAGYLAHGAVTAPGVRAVTTAVTVTSTVYELLAAAAVPTVPPAVPAVPSPNPGPAVPAAPAAIRASGPAAAKPK